MSLERLAAPPVTYDRSDYAALVRQNRPPALQPFLLVAALLSAVAVVLTAMMFLIQGRIMWRETIVLLVALCVLLFVLRIFPGLAARVMMSSARRTGANVEQHFSIDDDGFRAESSRGITLCRWPSVHRVVADDDRLFVFPQPHVAFVVPRRVFPSDQAFATFVTATTERFSAEGPT